MQALAEKPVTKKKREGVTGKMFYIDDDLMEAFQAFLEAQEIEPSQTAIFETALKAYLKSKGFWPRPKSGT